MTSGSLPSSFPCTCQEPPSVDLTCYFQDSTPVFVDCDDIQERSVLTPGVVVGDTAGQEEEPVQQQRQQKQQNERKRKQQRQLLLNNLMHFGWSPIIIDGCQFLDSISSSSSSSSSSFPDDDTTCVTTKVTPPTHDEIVKLFSNNHGIQNYNKNNEENENIMHNDDNDLVKNEFYKMYNLTYRSAESGSVALSDRNESDNEKNENNNSNTIEPKESLELAWKDIIMDTTNHDTSTCFQQQEEGHPQQQEKDEKHSIDENENNRTTATLQLQKVHDWCLIMSQIVNFICHDVLNFPCNTLLPKIELQSKTTKSINTKYAEEGKDDIVNSNNNMSMNDNYRVDDRDDDDKHLVNNVVDLMRVFYYHAVHKNRNNDDDDDDDDDEKVICGSSPHTDWGSWTIVWQDTVGGLETYCRKRQRWIPVSTTTTADTIDTDTIWNCIVHVGDMASIVLGDDDDDHQHHHGMNKNKNYHYYWSSPKHRVVTSNQERTSLVYFAYPPGNLTLWQIRQQLQEWKQRQQQLLLELEEENGTQEHNNNNNNNTGNDTKNDDSNKKVKATTKTSTILDTTCSMMLPVEEYYLLQNQSEEQQQEEKEGGGGGGNDRVLEGPKELYEYFLMKPSLNNDMNNITTNDKSTSTTTTSSSSSSSSRTSPTIQQIIQYKWNQVQRSGY